MAVFKKIYKKTDSNSYSEIATASDINNNEIVVFDKVLGQNPNGLIPTPTKSSVNKYMNGKFGWQNVTFVEDSFDIDTNLGIYFNAGMDGCISEYTGYEDLWEFVISKNVCLTRSEYNKIEQLKGGYHVIDSDHKAFIDGDIYDTYKKMYGNVLSSYNNNNGTITTNTSSYKAVSTITHTKTERLDLDDNTLPMCVCVMGNTADTYDGHGYTPIIKRLTSGISVYNKIGLITLAATFRVYCNSGTNGASAEIVPFINGTRSAYQSHTIYSGGNFNNAYVFTYLFNIDADNTQATTIELYSKAISGTPVINLCDANFTIVDVPNSYFLVNNTTPISSTRNEL